MNEILIKNACYSKQMIIFATRITSVLCWCRNMRQKALRSFPNRYLFSLYHKVTSSFSIRYVLEIILQCKMKQVASWFDANHMVFQRDFISAFALTFITSWMSKRCKLLRNSTYLERRQCTFWIHQAFKSFCKIRWKDLTYFPLTVKSCGKVHSFGTKHLVINSFSGLKNKRS